MPTVKPSDSKAKKQKVMEERMHDFKMGKMHAGIGGQKGRRVKAPVTDRKQAIAIALSESGQSKSKRTNKRKSSRR